MDRRELCEALASEGVADGLYEIPGFHESELRPVDFRYLRQEGDAWVVGTYERGVYQSFRRFDDEDAACRFLYGQLTRKGPGPGPDAADETESILREREEIQRAAREDFERARREESRER
jgi:hypothetical protein